MKKNTKKTRVYVGRSFLARSISQASLFFLIFGALNLVQIRAQASSGESSLAAQSGAPKDDDYKLRRGDNEFAVWGAGSFDAPTPIGSTYRPIAMLGLRYGRILGANHLGTLEYVADVIPIQIVFNPQNVRGAGDCVYGVGINYGGLKVSYLRRSRVKPFVGVSGGLIVYTRPVPLEGRKLNFTYSLDAGLDIFTSKKQALTVGYKFYHASNAVTTNANIGTNDNMISIGFSFFR
jgi:lipid A 3-O-deacylase PagL